METVIMTSFEKSARFIAFEPIELALQATIKAYKFAKGRTVNVICKVPDSPFTKEFEASVIEQTVFSGSILTGMLIIKVRRIKTAT